MSGAIVGVVAVLLGAAGGAVIGWNAYRYKLLKRMERYLDGEERIQKR